MISDGLPHKRTSNRNARPCRERIFIEGFTARRQKAAQRRSPGQIAGLLVGWSVFVSMGEPRVSVGPGGRRVELGCLGRAEHHGHLAAPASRTTQPLGDSGNRKVSPPRADQGFEVEVFPVAASTLVLHAFAAIVQAAYVDLPT
jgi:hypothetical protein